MPVSPTLADELVATAHALADAARVATLQHFRRADLVADTKESTTLRSGDRRRPAVRGAHARDSGRRRPDDAILGEEFGPKAGTSGLTWVLDPIDGTRGYLSGTPTWGVLISVRDDAGPIYGIIDQPYIGERFEGGLGRARVVGPMGEAALATRAARPLAESILFSTFPEVGTPDDSAAFRRVASKARLVRYGTDCYAYALVAAGQIDLVIEAGLQAYDVQAPIAVIEAAGGIVTDWQGRPAHDGGRILAAANRTIHAEALALLNG
jgi:histidinol phosphatase-like enzyme (inositol monophosphatase family)